MVRAIAGTLINVGRGYWPAEQVAAILAAEDRVQAGPTAPAQGLFPDASDLLTAKSPTVVPRQKRRDTTVRDMYLLDCLYL